MLYLIGLGLNEKGLSKGAADAVKRADKAYLENYTVEFPYSISTLEKELGVKIFPANRDLVEHAKELISEAAKKDVALLVYGSPLMATTHIALLEEARKSKVKTKVLHAASVFDAVAETGLQAYKFGKTASMPKFPAESYLEILEGNQKIKAHTLILVDIGYKFKDALARLGDDANKKNVKLDKIVVCSRLGNNDGKIVYGSLEKLQNEGIMAPFCFVIPGELHFLEREVLENFNK